MNRWLWFSLCAFGGLALLALGLLLPIHLRAVDTVVIQKAGERPPQLIEYGLALVREGKLGPAQLLLDATPADVPNREKLRAAVARLAADEPSLVYSGGGASPQVERLYASDPQPPRTNFESLTSFVIRLENRDVVLEFLRTSTNAGVQELLRCRSLNNTAIFSPSTSSSGQAFDAAISVAGLLLEENRLTPHLRDELTGLAAKANQGASSEPLELALLDLLSLGQRFNWGQLAEYVGRTEDADTLRKLTALVRHDEQVPVLFSAVAITGTPTAVVRYVMDFSVSGLKDLASSLRYGAGGVVELARRDQRLAPMSDFSKKLAAVPVVHSIFRFEVDCSRWTPGLALALKWLLFLSAGFLIAFALHFAHPALSQLELPIQVQGFHFAREVLFALGFLAAALLVSEPFLSDDSQKIEMPIRIHLPAVAGAATAPINQTHTAIMNQSLLTLLLFFVLQGLLFIASLVKLAEIKRQHAPSRVKLKLLENEDHLFDAGLYLGFVGTIISFILASLGITKLSLMGAYSSTSFGIIFVSCFKIFSLRPARRKMLLEAEMGPAEPAAPAPLAAPALAPTP